MQEAFLQFVWQFQYFTHQDLYTFCGQPLTILHPGILNTNAGPDFLQAKIKIGNIEWVGNVEIHYQSSEWFQHRHESDPAYQNVILHVVWKHDKEVHRTDRTLLPVLALAGKVSEGLIEKYRELAQTLQVPACKSQFTQVPSLAITNMLDKSLMERLYRKAGQVLELLQRCKQDWEATAYCLLAQNFGFKLNREPFEKLAFSLPLKILLRHSPSQTQIDALVFGQANMLGGDLHTAYAKMLKREYRFLAHKYQLYTRVELHEWKFLRLRPANFPSVRLAQFARLIAFQKGLFSKLLFTKELSELRRLFAIEPAAYWQKHYMLDKPSKKALRGMGQGSIDNLLINTIVPLLAAYSLYKDYPQMMERAIAILEQLPAEKNKITSSWQDSGMNIKTAFDSQASLELYNNFCRSKKCLNCMIGVALIK
ncbi:DUF2851 family protein [Rapidithrix thailandica]|uniref:DUF2851 family protein n=1 Tax=Rapidithrix thailandica TaxID=413964 RepID=A0AAW9SBC9_9BACT